LCVFRAPLQLANRQGTTYFVANYSSEQGFRIRRPVAKAEVLQAVKQLQKGVGASDAIICDMAGEQTSHQRFCQEIGTVASPRGRGRRANKAELYIGLIKEAVRKDMKESDLPTFGTVLNVTDQQLDCEKTSSTPMGRMPTCTHWRGEVIYQLVSIQNGHDWCYFREQGKFPFNGAGRVLGPAREGNVNGSVDTEGQW
jgi:hypothetical protein